MRPLPPLRRFGLALALAPAALVVAAATPLSAFAARAWAVTGAPRQADVIVVLGGGVVWPGELTADSLQRLQHAVWLYHRGYSPRLLVTGGTSGAEMPAGADLMRAAAMAMGVPPEAVVAEGRASCTRENAAYSAAIMRRRGWRSALLVTDAVHMRRALLAFARERVPSHPAASYTPGVVFTTPGRGLTVLEDTGYEVAATLVYRFRGWA